MKKINRTPEEQEIIEKGLICDGKPLPKKKEKIPPFPGKDSLGLTYDEVFGDKNKASKKNHKKDS